MKIDSSTISMNSGRAYTTSVEITQATAMTQLDNGASSISARSFKASYVELSGMQSSKPLTQYDTYDKALQGSDEQMPLASDLYTNLAGSKNNLESIRSTLDELHRQLIEQIEELMERIRNQLLGRGNVGVNAPQLLDYTTRPNQPGSFFTRQEYTKVSFMESETTVFSGTGQVQTADGRSINFDISMEMSRSFMEECESLTEETQYILTDPLVIKLNDAPDTIEPQTWKFDIDGDGNLEEINQLASGNGFLALDANDNGIIDDGSELFGTKSGNGFKDLAAYDEDGNGWIDENDSVYSKLKVWTKDANGKDKLMNLYQADVGAIYLGAANTTFSHKNLDNNDTQAVVKQTGFYLHESTGNAGILQQIDFATKPKNEVA